MCIKNLKYPSKMLYNLYSRKRMSVLASMIDWIDYRLEPLMYVFGVVLIFLVHVCYKTFSYLVF